MEKPQNVKEDDADFALQLQIEAIEKEEQLRRIAERDEHIATREQAEQFFASNKAALLAVEGEDYARRVQATQESRGLELYTQYPHLDAVKGDRNTNQYRQPTQTPPPAAAGVTTIPAKQRIFATPPGSPTHSPAGSPRKVGGISSMKSWLPAWGGGSKEEKTN